MEEQLTPTQVLDLACIKRTKCKVCGNDIVYNDTKIYFSKMKNHSVVIKGHSYKSIKVVNNIEYHLCVCEKCLRDKFPEINNMSRTFNVMSEPTKFAFDISNEDYENSRNKYAMTKEHMIEKYGEEEGNKIWENYCKRQAETNTFEYKKKKYGMTKREFKEYNNSRAVTKKNLVKKYGEEEGNRKWNEYVEKQKITKSWDYMVEHFGEEKAREINRKKLMIEDNFIRKYGKTVGIVKYQEWLKNKNCGFSKVSQKFLKELDKYLGEKYNTHYATKNNETTLYCNSTHSHYSLDYYIPELKICVEFNGSCYHGDPRVFNDNDICNPFSNLTAKQLREKDQERHKALEKEYGIRTFVVWELDYKNGIDIEDFITNTQKIEL